ncbi:unnamed protein product [Miscanthus lutarioriparius]|uniref:GDP-L-fucose synthase n=1 Tax=Miscanthus lutarioriparius TaxID=422564 RepID=A0A811SDP1_9POAL|nr:unnamed protein product [Miscanthus lutarioriparius]
MGTVTAADPHPSFLADKDAKVFVAGHRGLVGSAIVRRLLSLGFTSVVVRTHAELDLTRQADVEAFFAAERPRYVVLAAAKVGGIHANSTYPADFIAANLQIQTNVVDAALRCGSVRKLLFLGSSCIYPKFAPQPITEGALLSGPLEPTNEWYAVAKIAGIKMCQAYRIQHGLDAVSAMPTNLYGPHDNFHPENSHVLPALIRRFHEAKATNAPEVVVWGSGSPLREFLHVDDLADGVIFLMDQYSGLEHVNVGSGSEVTIKELAELVKEVVGFRGTWCGTPPSRTAHPGSSWIAPRYRDGVEAQDRPQGRPRRNLQMLPRGYKTCPLLSCRGFLCKRAHLGMGNVVSGVQLRRRLLPAVEERLTRPRRLVRELPDLDAGRLCRLIRSGDLAPCFDPAEDAGGGLTEECPICFFFYPSLNTSKCCGKGICTGRTERQ